MTPGLALAGLASVSALGLALVAAACGSSSSAGGGAAPTGDAGAGRAVKVMIVNMSVLEGPPFVSGLGLNESVPVAGLTLGDPNVHCNADDVCEVTTGMGYGNAATSMTVLLSSPAFDLTHTYFILAGIAGIDAAQGTLGTAAWARYVVDMGLGSEIDAREMPAGWAYGSFGAGATSPGQAPATTYGTEVFQVDETFLQAALALSSGAKLDDSSQAAATRANYPAAPANQPPVVTQCDETSSDTWIAGAALQQRARDWMKLQTHGAGTFCTSAQEDNATLEVLTRGAAAGVVDMRRVAVLRTASDFAAPYPGQTDAACLLGSLGSGGLSISASNLAHAAQPVIQAIVAGWSQWASGVPKM